MSSLNCQYANKVLVYLDHAVLLLVGPIQALHEFPKVLKFSGSGTNHRALLNDGVLHSF